jgi:hypothetical protein
MREAIARDKKSWAMWQKPDVDEVQCRRVVAQVEEEVMPSEFLVLICPVR